MLGLYSLIDRDAVELPAFARLVSAGSDTKPLAHGPLAVAAPPGAEVSHAREGDITCAMTGVLYEPEATARALGMAGAADARLVAVAYRRAQAAGLARLRGRFAAVAWDGASRQGVLAGDLLAARELFVSFTSDGLLFATELRDLLMLLATRPGPDPVGFTAWLAEGTCPADRTLYDGIGRLRAGELIALAPRSAQRRQFWRPQYRSTLAGTPTELGEGLRAHLQAAIAKRMSPRASAVILSGGLDSAIVTAVAATVKPPGAQVRTYSAVFPGEEYDESAKIRLVNERVGIAPAALQIAPQGTLWLALHYTRSWRLPLIAAGSLIDIAATRAAAEDGAEVILDGQTGDELFGFSPYLVADRLRRGRLLAALALTEQWPIGRRTTLRNKVWLLKEMGVKAATPHRVGRVVQGRRDQYALGPAWLIPPLRRQFAESRDRWAWKGVGRGPMWWRFLADVLTDAPHRELRLEYLRHRAATYGLIAEPPLYDVDLVQYCLRLPPELAFDRRFTRPLVREAMRDLLPEQVRVQTQKADFTKFCERALATADAPGIARLLMAPDALIGEYTDLDWVHGAWARVQEGRGTPAEVATTWRLTAAEVWLRAQADPAFVDNALDRPDVPAPAVRRVSLPA